MKQNMIITLNFKSEEKQDVEPYDINKSKTQADLLIRQMRERLSQCYDNTLIMLDDMDTKYKGSIENINKNLLEMPPKNDKILFDSEFDKILYLIREWRV